MPPRAPDDPAEVYSVSRLATEARILLESGFGTLWVEGELSNLARPSSGHLYFTLKDTEAQVRCAMFRQRKLRLAFDPEDGLAVLVRARPSIYTARGDFQLIVEHMEAAGDGALRLAFEALKQRLAAEGLFDSERKRPLPTLPACVGVVTSPSGAAVRDVLTTLERRFPALPVVLYPVPVQGEDAPERIVRTLGIAAARAECEVLILARGGGGLEDLQAFNDERVARAIAASPIPVVVGVGHEIDFTIADFAADLRAPTPTAAAEMVSPDAGEWLQQLEGAEARLLRAIETRARRARAELKALTERMERQHPLRRLRERAQRLDELEQRLRLGWRGVRRAGEARLAGATAALGRANPRTRLERLRMRHDQLALRLRSAARHGLAARTERLKGVVRALDAVSPLATLERGYAVLSRAADGTVVRDARAVAEGERVDARLHRGRLRCRVERSEPGD